MVHSSYRYVHVGIIFALYLTILGESINPSTTSSHLYSSTYHNLDTSKQLHASTNDKYLQIPQKYNNKERKGSHSPLARSVVSVSIISVGNSYSPYFKTVSTKVRKPPSAKSHSPIWLPLSSYSQNTLTDPENTVDPIIQISAVNPFYTDIEPPSSSPFTSSSKISVDKAHEPSQVNLLLRSTSKTKAGDTVSKIYTADKSAFESAITNYESHHTYAEFNASILGETYNQTPVLILYHSTYFRYRMWKSVYTVSPEILSDSSSFDLGHSSKISSSLTTPYKYDATIINYTSEPLTEHIHINSTMLHTKVTSKYTTGRENSTIPTLLHSSTKSLQYYNWESISKMSATVKTAIPEQTEVVPDSKQHSSNRPTYRKNDDSHTLAVYEHSGIVDRTIEAQNIETSGYRVHLLSSRNTSGTKILSHMIPEQSSRRHETYLTSHYAINPLNITYNVTNWVNTTTGVPTESLPPRVVAVIVTGSIIGFWVVLVPLICIICKLRDKQKAPYEVVKSMSQEMESGITEKMVMNEMIRSQKKREGNVDVSPTHLSNDNQECELLQNGDT